MDYTIAKNVLSFTTDFERDLYLNGVFYFLKYTANIHLIDDVLKEIKEQNWGWLLDILALHISEEMDDRKNPFHDRLYDVLSNSIDKGCLNPKYFDMFYEFFVAYDEIHLANIIMILKQMKVLSNFQKRQNLRWNGKCLVVIPEDS